MDSEAAGFIERYSVIRTDLTRTPLLKRLAHRHRYGRNVFLTSPWPEIYVKDNERRHDLDDGVDEYRKREVCMKRQLGTAAISAGVILAMAWLGVTSYFGAHPVAWPFQVALLGAPAGAVIALVAGVTLPSRSRRVILFVALLLAAWGLAHYGKIEFSASYAEDRLAGQFWYYGWIATCAMATSVLATVTGR